ncbi:hypothetical protein LEP1GSC199_1248 [Leptospira vanthielii serovar Holland str. Waz Holland = ATCC 700522]|uniref:Uncharacterized protein n=1 Tax=Leptospira vanthielii serovar Holland str. Waz Holland = ATCC 700522 TaxID=1218591 RepID=N1W1Q0_9LEPT|nr:hypothetical protein LEP1GSC199_1248 [Leptospira vanthielii serovar Holland str. Waz Holland = ATCC 700522]
MVVNTKSPMRHRLQRKSFLVGERITKLGLIQKDWSVKRDRLMDRMRI